MYLERIFTGLSGLVGVSDLLSELNYPSTGNLVHNKLEPSLGLHASNKESNA